MLLNLSLARAKHETEVDCFGIGQEKIKSSECPFYQIRTHDEFQDDRDSEAV
jgi:hypothetical protein